jgi:hypothetical protein
MTGMVPVTSGLVPTQRGFASRIDHPRRTRGDDTVSEPVYLYSDQRRHIADPEDTSRARRRALCSALFLTEDELVARFRRFLTGDLTLNRRIEKARKLPVCAWCSRRYADHSSSSQPQGGGDRVTDDQGRLAGHGDQR